MNTLELILDRKWKKKDYTIGNLSINDEFFCNILEDTCRGLQQNMPLSELQAKKIYGKTAIPAGRYEIVITHSNRFQRPLPLLLNVPAFEGIRIHAGNAAKDTHGCLLPGKNVAVGKVLHSRPTTAKLIKHINDAISNGKKVFITIKE